jgi:hypothetical protein
MTNVYICPDDRRSAFLSELVSLEAVHGDFNLVRDPENRSNELFDAAAAGAFNATIDARLCVAVPSMP